MSNLDLSREDELCKTLAPYAGFCSVLVYVARGRWGGGGGAEGGEGERGLKKAGASYS